MRQHSPPGISTRRRQLRKAGCCCCTCCTHCWLGVFTACGWLCLGCGPRAFAPVCRGCCRYNALWITFCESRQSKIQTLQRPVDFLLYAVSCFEAMLLVCDCSWWSSMCLLAVDPDC